MKRKFKIKFKFCLQEAERRAEKQNKVLQYKNAMGAILGMRGKEGAEGKLLKMTAGVLMGNPDIK